MSNSQKPKGIRPPSVAGGTPRPAVDPREIDRLTDELANRPYGQSKVVAQEQTSAPAAPPAPAAPAAKQKNSVSYSCSLQPWMRDRLEDEALANKRAGAPNKQPSKIIQAALKQYWGIED